MESGHSLGQSRRVNINDFCAACEWVAGDGLDIRQANYDGQHFGSWSIDVRQGGKLRRAFWDGRDRWLLFQTKQADGSWTDDWIGRNADEQKVERVVDLLRG